MFVAVLLRIPRRHLVLSAKKVDMLINKPLMLTYLYLLIYILLSSGVILYNKVRHSSLICKVVALWLILCVLLTDVGMI